ncbi:MAG: hypothetical protein Q7Q71_04670 [Verrucomicrobiota bacterium JB023]|nr:hypothetical protein [Verrucomicrobiota bacterium JB023]
MRLSTLLFLSLAAATARAEKIDLVRLGQETFHGLGCSECHALMKDDPSFKTGPGLFGVFQKDPIKHKVQGGDARHDVPADLKYLTDSLRDPTADLAIMKTGEKAGEPYLPVMPPYDEKVLPKQKVEAIYHYLLTLNEEENAGPKVVMAEKAKPAAAKTALTDPAEILVTERTRIFRARLPEVSARAVHVGMPNGFNYSFDPRTLSVERIWWGGFLNIEQELKGRASKLSRIGEQAKEIELAESLLAPLDPATKKPVDLSFKSPAPEDEEQIVANMNGANDFLDQLAASDADFLGYKQARVPVFYYQVGENLIGLQFEVSAEGQATITLDGELTQPQTFRLSSLIRGESEDWTVSEFPAELTFQLPVQPAWRPWKAETLSGPQPAKTSTPSAWLPKGFSAETIQPPLDPHGRVQLFEPLGMDEDEDGSLLISTRNSGIWRLKEGSWQQVADGLLDALGLIVEDDGSIVVAQKPELTRLRDRDGDGWFEFFETINDDYLFTHNYHEYLHGPAKDAAGNYYVQTNLGHRNDNPSNYTADGRYMGTQGGLRGWSLQISPEGQMTPFASGLRSPAGLATGPDGKIYYTENQGEYVGTSKLFVLEKDKFYGHPSGLIDLPGKTPASADIKWDQVKEGKEKALALMAHSHLANAPGSPVWAPEEGNFALYAGQMFVGDQTLSQVFRILPQENFEAALIPFAQGFDSGAMRLLFANDGGFYIGQTGRGWRAQGGKEDGLVRVTRTDEPIANQLLDLTRDGDEFIFSFAQPLTSVPEAEAIQLSSWAYLDSPKYGSPEMDKVDTPIASVQLNEEKDELRLTVTELPLGEDNRVYQFISEDLPKTTADGFKAFYSITLN